MAATLSRAVVAVGSSPAVAAGSSSSEASTRSSVSMRWSNASSPFGGLQASSRGNVKAAYSVTLKTKDDGDVTFEVDGSTYILDAAEEAGVDLPYSCRAGGDSRPVGRVVSGRRAGGAGVRADMRGVRDFGPGDRDSQGRGSAVGLQRAQAVSLT
jgi:hypothetical protein